MQTACFAAFARLWHAQLEQCYPFWTSAGIYPVCGRRDGETWKQLVSTAYGVVLPGPEVGHITHGIPVNYQKMISDIWDKGQLTLCWKVQHQQSNRSMTNGHA